MWCTACPRPSFEARKGSHLNAAVEVIADGVNSRLVWTIDVLPHEIASYISGQMDEAARAMQQALNQAGSDAA